MEQRLSIRATLMTFTALFVLAQLILFWQYYAINGLFNIAGTALTPSVFFSRVVLFPLFYFIAAQCLVYVAYIYVLWYLLTQVCRLFSLSSPATFCLTFLTWVDSVIFIVLLNMALVPHSIFTTMIRGDLFNDGLTDAQVTMGLTITVGWLLAITGCAFIQVLIDLYKRQQLMNHALMALFVLAVTFFNYPKSPTYNAQSAATTHQPNIIIIGFDALRPDYLSYFNAQQPATPHFDHFLKSATVFKDAFTPVARTLPAWGGILTGRYPLHNGIRENNVYVPTHALTDTLPKTLKQAGYDTIYATDDRRFNNIDNRYGFDQLVGPSGTMADFFIGTLSDFPLSNMVAVSRLGKYLFPYNYANHGANHTYSSEQFLSEVQAAINNTGQQPLFLAVHFDISAWPFKWFNDHQAYNVSIREAYQHAVLADDALLGQFLNLLQQNHLLEHAIVVVLSDHGISLASPGERVIREEQFRGRPDAMRVRRTRYASAQQHVLTTEEAAETLLEETMGIKSFLYRHNSAFQKNYGIDTSFGYGGDVLTLKQHQVLLAVRGYGVNIGSPRVIDDRVMLLDLAPTLLSLLQLPALPSPDGLSLQPLLTAQQALPVRPIFLESGFSFHAIEQEDIILSKVLASSIAFYMMSPRTGWVLLNPDYLDVLIQNKQRGVLWGDWLLVYYPVSERFQLKKKLNTTVPDDWEVRSHSVSPYYVFVNLKTGEWTTVMAKATIDPFDRALETFYGDEMSVYHYARMA